MASNEEYIKKSTKLYCRLTIVITIILTLFILYHIVYVEILKEPVLNKMFVIFILIFYILLIANIIIVIYRGLSGFDINISNNNKFNKVFNWLLLPISIIMFAYFHFTRKIKYD
jgi:TRAP-type uncharacterized transport system fused permease subunit